MTKNEAANITGGLELGGTSKRAALLDYVEGFAGTVGGLVEIGKYLS